MKKVLCIQKNLLPLQSKKETKAFLAQLVRASDC